MKGSFQTSSNEKRDFPRSMLREARAYLHNAWWMATFPGLAIPPVVGLHLCGNRRGDHPDPRLRS